MQTIIVDDKSAVVSMLQRILKRVDPAGTHTGYTDVRAALQDAAHIRIDAAFLDIEMPGTDGITLAKQLQQMQPLMNIIFITGHLEYMPEAFALYASDYIMKPVTEQAVVRALSHLRYHAEPQPAAHGLQVQCFGSFEVFQAGKPLRFTRQKCKELFAYLIDRHGAVCSNDMIIGNLWPDESPNETRKSMVRTLVTELAKTLRQAEAEDALIRMQGGVSVDINRLDCDYYRFLNGDPLALHAFHGEYMTQYSFAEETRAALQQQLPASE